MGQRTEKIRQASHQMESQPLSTGPVMTRGTEASVASKPAGSGMTVLLNLLGIALVIAGGVVAFIQISEGPARQELAEARVQREKAEGKLAKDEKTDYGSAEFARAVRDADEIWIEHDKDVERIWASKIHPEATWVLAAGLGVGGLILVGLAAIYGSLARRATGA